MKKLCKALLGVVCLFGILIPSVNVNAQPNDKTLSELEEKIKKYDEIISKYDNKLKEVDIELSKNKSELKEDFIKLKEQWVGVKDELDKKKNELDKKTNEAIVKVDSIETIMKIAGFSGVLGIWIAIKGALKYVKTKVKNQIEDDLNLEKEKVVEWAKNYDYENALIARKKIIILSTKRADECAVRSIMDKFKSDYKIIGDSFKKDDYDMILFNDYDGKLDEEIIKGIVEKSKNGDEKVYFYFSMGPRWLNNCGTENISYASSKVTLYNNVINTLKYQDKAL